jgi:two-component system, cell cycle response regulator CpdR
MARILIAEDNAALSAHIAAQVRKTGHTVTICDSSLGAWRAIGRDAFDAMLISVSMPGIDGFVLAQRALQDNPATRVIFMTGFAAVAMDTAATPAYAPAPFTSRPFHLNSVAERLNALLFGFTPEAANAEETGTVIHADFGGKK